MVRRPVRIIGRWLLVAVPIALVALLLQIGRVVTGDHAGRSATTGAVTAHAQTIGRLMLSLAVAILAARFVGALFERAGQTRVIGEIAAGLLLGPSLFGALAPGLFHVLFPPELLPYLNALANVGLVLFMFLVGLELPASPSGGWGRQVLAISYAGLAVPFVLGVAIAIPMFAWPGIAGPGIPFGSFALFMALALSITAFPVLARILLDRGMHNTRVGGVCLSAAGLGDVAAWCLLAGVVAVVGNGSAGGVATVVTLAVLFCAVMVLVVRPLMRRLVEACDAGRVGFGELVAVLTAGILVSSYLTDAIGIHAFFGAFLFGAITPRRSVSVKALTLRMETSTMVFLLPLFFLEVGLRVELGSLGGDWAAWTACLLVLVAAVLGKWLGCGLAARATGMNRPDSLRTAALMNSRGLTELVIADVGLRLGILTEVSFAILVLMALVTTLMTAPLLRLVDRWSPPAAPPATGPGDLGAVRSPVVEEGLRR